MRKGDERKQEILTAAEKLFCARGYQETGVQDILDALKVSKGAFYHHFESKGSVLETLCTQRAEKAAERTREALTKSEDALARLNIVLQGVSPLCMEEAAFLSMLLPQLFTHEGRTVCVAYQEALHSAFLPMMTEAVSAAAADGVIAPAGGEDLADLLLVMMNHCWMHVAKMLLSQIDKAAQLSPAALLDALTLYRAAMERLLDAPFGSIHLSDLEEWSKVAQEVERRIVLPVKV
ncbi:MAG: TetR/AcrR family transcriptional regulator [Clostridia bacterium]|nr:TetR/AcrR family transcriptional regulator [Clostridia bacterium]